MQESKPIPELGNRTWEELEIVEHADGHLLFKDKIRRITKTGKFEDVPVRVRIARPMELIQARGKARLMFAQIEGLDQDRDKDAFEAIEQFLILEHAIRTDKAPHGQFATAEELANQYDDASLQDLLGRIQALRMMVDPREVDLTRDKIWGVIQAVAESGNLLPLADIAGHEHSSFIIFMASQCMRSPMGLAWLQSQGNSTPAHSPETNSSESSPEPTG